MAFVNGTVDFDLTAATLLLTGTLSFQSFANDPIEAAVYASGNGLATGTAYRYLRSNAGDYYDTGSGLNEIRVFSDESAAVPEPGTMLLVGGGLMACAVRRGKRRRVTG